MTTQLVILPRLYGSEGLEGMDPEELIEFELWIAFVTMFGQPLV